MRTKVTVDGMGYGRDDIAELRRSADRATAAAKEDVALAHRIEQAFAAPEPLAAGDIVTRHPGGQRFVVLMGGDSEKMARERYLTVINEAHIVVTDGRSTYNGPASAYTRVGHLEGVKQQ